MYTVGGVSNISLAKSSSSSPPISLQDISIKPQPASNFIKLVDQILGPAVAALFKFVYTSMSSWVWHGVAGQS